MRVQQGRHEYRHRKDKPSVCIKCGTRVRRSTPTGMLEYAIKGSDLWGINAGCPPRYGDERMLPCR